MPSGAGHDAMKLHEVMPQAMLFVRGLNAGISHNRSNPSPTTTPISACAPSPTCSANSPKNCHGLPTVLDAWIDAHFDEQVRFPAGTGAVPTDTPPGNNAPHAERTAELLKGFGFAAESTGAGRAGEYRLLESITNLIVRRKYGAGGPVALNAHGDVVPPGEGWTHDPYGGEGADGSSSTAAPPR